MDIKKLRENIYYRQPLSERKFNRLLEDIRQNGIKEPLLIEIDPSDKNKYLIIDGISRFRIALLLKLTELPVTIYNTGKGI